MRRANYILPVQPTAHEMSAVQTRAAEEVRQREASQTSCAASVMPTGPGERGGEEIKYRYVRRGEVRVFVERNQRRARKGVARCYGNVVLMVKGR